MINLTKVLDVANDTIQDLEYMDDIDYIEDWKYMVEIEDYSAIAYAYFIGHGITRDVRFAIMIMEAYINSLFGKKEIKYFQLGNMYYYLKDYINAKTCYEKAIENARFNKPIKDESQRCLDQLQIEKNATDEDVCIGRLGLLAIERDSLAQLKLAIFYYNYINRRQAAFWFRKLALKGDLEAQCFLALCYYDQTGNYNKTDKVFQLFKGAAEKGNRHAQYYFADLLNYCYKNKNEEKPWSIKKLSLKYYLKSADNGNLMAIGYMSTVYYELEPKLENSMRTYETNKAVYTMSNDDSKKFELERKYEDYFKNKEEISALLSKAKKYTNLLYYIEKRAEQGEVGSLFMLLLLLYRPDAGKRLVKSKKFQKALNMILEHPEKDKLDKPPYGMYDKPIFSEFYGWIEYECQDYSEAFASLSKVIELEESGSIAKVQPRTYACLANMYYYGMGTEKYKDRGAYLYSQMSSAARDLDERKVGKKALDTYNRIQAKQRKNDKGGGGCFITTAVCDSFGEKDDCYELNLFRSFRDNWLIYQPDGKDLIEKYYSIAPAIVTAINNCHNAKSIYLKIWNYYLYPCICFIENGRFKDCKDLYISMVRGLEDKYLTKKEGEKYGF